MRKTRDGEDDITKFIGVDRSQTLVSMFERRSGAEEVRPGSAFLCALSHSNLISHLSGLVPTRSFSFYFIISARIAHETAIKLGKKEAKGKAKEQTKIKIKLKASAICERKEIEVEDAREKGSAEKILLSRERSFHCGSLWRRFAERREISSIFLLFINFKLTQNEKRGKEKNYELLREAASRDENLADDNCPMIERAPHFTSSGLFERA
jgi:hypothetical protein